MSRIQVVRRTVASLRKVVKTARKEVMSKFHPIDSEDLEASVLKATESLKNGNVIAVPTDTIYGVAGLAQDNDAIEEIYDIKKRNHANPIAISVAEIEDIYRWSKVTVCKQILSDLLPGPVTVVFKRRSTLNPDLNPHTSLVGIRIPDHKFIRELARSCDGPIALTSANISTKQSALAIEEFKDLWPKLDLIFDAGRLGDTPSSRLGSTVIDLSEQGKFKIIREGCAFKDTREILKNKHDLKEL